MMANIFDIAGSGMAAQNQRLNLIASNLANANSTSSESGEAYRAKQRGGGQGHNVVVAVVDRPRPPLP